MFLPAYQELDKEQDAVLNLPLSGKYLVGGPPGSGKTVVLLHRADRLKRQKEPLQLVMYMRVLSRYVQSAAEELDIDGDVVTFHTWFRHYYKKAVGHEPPRLGDEWTYDWPTILRDFGKRPIGKNSLPNVLIDEGQDLPKEFYPVVNYMARNLTVFADENQRLTEHQSTVREIQDFGSISDIFYLRKNYRNTEPIARLASKFYCGLRTGIPELPSREGERPQLRGFEKVYDSVDAIVRYERTNADLHIGVLLPRRDLVHKYMNRLTNKTRNELQYYDSKDPTCDKSALDFEKPGIFLCAYPSAKGLEFDTVFLPEMQVAAGKLDWNKPEFRMRMYVMISRARDRLFISWTGERPAVADAFPADLIV
jgi:superfamily I DNA/RNA helicase